MFPRRGSAPDSFVEPERIVAVRMGCIGDYDTISVTVNHDLLNSAPTVAEEEPSITVTSWRSSYKPLTAPQHHTIDIKKFVHLVCDKPDDLPQITRPKPFFCLTKQRNS